MLNGAIEKKKKNPLYTLAIIIYSFISSFFIFYLCLNCKKVSYKRAGQIFKVSNITSEVCIYMLTHINGKVASTSENCH